MNAPGAPVLELRGVTRTFASPRGPVNVLNGIALTVVAGEFVGLTGPSGSGKTTLLNIAGLLDRPSAGVVRIEGRDVSQLDEAAVDALRARRIGMVFQRFCLLMGRTVLENVLFRFRYAPVPDGNGRDLALRALEAVGLAPLADQSARLLSGGEMQRVAIARAVALPPALLLVDEPTGNLDTASAGAVMEGFRRLHARGITIVLATHNPALLPYCTRHVGLHAGCVIDEEAAR